MIQSSSRTLHFPPFHISSDVDLLYRADRVVPLEQRAVRVLRYLAEHPERIVSKEELLENLWPKVFTTDGVLKKAVFQARRALGDNAQGARFIETFHKCGYQFVAPVVIGDPATAEPNHSLLGHRIDSGSGVAKETRNRKSSLRDNSSNGPTACSSEPDYDQLVGREAQLVALRADYTRTLKGRGCQLVVIGEAGVGKTQLARHFQSWACEQGALSLYGCFFDHRASRFAPYDVFLDFLRSGLGMTGTWPRGRGYGDESQWLRSVAEARLGVSLPEELFKQSGRFSAGSSACETFRFVASIGKCLVRLSRQQMLVMLIDDLQYADERSLDLVGYLMRAGRSERFMTVGLAQAKPRTSSEEPLTSWLERQADDRSCSFVVLRPLDANASRDAVQAIFGGSSSAPEMPPQDLASLHEISEGNPYVLTEMLRLLVAEGAICRAESDRTRWRWLGVKELRLPETIIMAARSRLDRLPGPVREIVEHASVIGDVFHVQVLSRMTGKSEDEVEGLLAEGVRNGVLCEHALTSGADYRFDHTILRRVLYDGLPTPERKRLRARAEQAGEMVTLGQADGAASSSGNALVAASRARTSGQ